MSGLFGIISQKPCASELYYGTDYHSHLGTRRGGLAAYDKNGKGLQREIHNIENSPFRTKFENIFNEMKGNAVIGAISDSDPQPLLIRGGFGSYAICSVGLIQNEQELIDEYLLRSGGHFNAMTGGKVNSTELVASLINEKDNIKDGIVFAQEKIKGTMTILVLGGNGKLYAARDKLGRLPVLIGRNEDGFCVSFESFAYKKLGYEDYKELGPGEIVEISADKLKVLRKPGEEMRICAFLWSYYGYPNSNYEGVNVEQMRYRNGEIMARDDIERGIVDRLDAVCGVRRRFTPSATMRSASTSRPLSVSSRMLSTGSSIAIWKISLRFFSPPEKPTLTSRFANSPFICTRAIFSFSSLRNSAGLSSGCPAALRRAFRAAFIKLVMLTPGISTGYWKLRKMPAQERSSGAISSRLRPS